MLTPKLINACFRKYSSHFERQVKVFCNLTVNVYLPTRLSSNLSSSWLNQEFSTSNMNGINKVTISDICRNICCFLKNPHQKKPPVYLITTKAKSNKKVL